MHKIVILGCGAVGKHLAIDLCKNPDYEVVSVDINREVLEALARDFPIKIRVEDLSSDKGVSRAVEDADIVIGSVPDFIGYSMLRQVIRSGKNIVDISYFLEDPFELDELAKEHGVTALVDCGVTPGLANIILGHHMREMKVERYECYVGGVPKSRKSPLAYKSPFPVLELLEEYAGSGTSVENGRVVVSPMIGEPKTIKMERIGTMACLNSDGLRTLLRTTSIPNMFEMTLRYPEHMEAMRILKEAGLFGRDPIQVKGLSVRPIDVAVSLLEPLWKYEANESDITVMKLVISGLEKGKATSYTYDMYDEYDPATGAPSMARTTGYTCNAVTRMVLDGSYTQKGICPPETVGLSDGGWECVKEYLAERGIHCQVKTSP